ncbi:hypothetical protein Tsubulata_010606 [Turnera subulata]|uniref:Cation/H+ exchanger transmembrane domain-containing protein n=1 Tax=Turnera subulata TaxID=218843 RepID=A0A9Q0J202_9ROSI|nr:hypothetical protein Tsubulata_010606 [Turnera subulata]
MKRDEVCDAYSSKGPNRTFTADSLTRRNTLFPLLPVPPHQENGSSSDFGITALAAGSLTYTRWVSHYARSLPILFLYSLPAMRLVLVPLLVLALLGPAAAETVTVSDEAEAEINATAALLNATLKHREDSFADMIDRALEKEFNETDQSEATDPGSFNNSVAGQQAVLETVARVRSKKNDTKKEDKSFFNLDNENGAEEIPTLIDRKVITGYLLAGSVIGPGGLSFVSEMVQVETVAQFGVIFLLFALGLEFSATKVLKFLMEKNSISAVHGQVTIGTLILQDCAVGLLFALLPVLGGTSGVLEGVAAASFVFVCPDNSISHLCALVSKAYDRLIITSKPDDLP